MKGKVFPHYQIDSQTVKDEASKISGIDIWIRFLGGKQTNLILQSFTSSI